jgi:alpha-galactosidase
MQRIKVVHVGAGSYVFGPGSLAQGLLELRADDLELVLVDPNDTARTLVAGVATRMADDAGLGRVEVRDAAGFDEGELAGADFVICSAAPGMAGGFEHVKQAVAEHAPDHPVTEFGGVHGVDCTLRNGHLVKRLAIEMRRVCPNATLLIVTNPLPRMCGIAHACGIDAVGFCSVSLAAYDWLDRLHGGPGERFPFRRSRSEFDVISGGVNHLAWLTDIRRDGTDAMPETMRRLGDGPVPSGWEHAADLGLRAGVPLAVADGHTEDFFPPRGTGGTDHVAHGDAAQRERLATNLRNYADGGLAWEAVGSTVPWERPWEFLLARAGRVGPATLHSLNLPNRGQVPTLPEGIYVETPARADASGIDPTRVDLPASAVELCRPAIATHEHLIRAVMDEDASAVRAALEADATVEDVEACLAACRSAAGRHAGLMPLAI